MKHRRLLTAGVVLTAFAVTVLCLLTFSEKYLLISNEETGEILFRTEAKDGEEFSVSYIHSVNKSPVTEYYQIQDTDIYLTAMRFRAFGAGIPEQPEEGQTMRIEGEDMVIEGYLRPIHNLCYFVGYTAEHTLHWRDEAIRLDELTEPGEPVLFSVTDSPRLMIMLKEVSAAWSRTN